MEQRISATEARIHFGELMRAAQEEPIIVERDGVPKVVVLSKQAYDDLLAQIPKHNWRDLVDDVHKQIRAELSGKTLPPPEQIIQQAREERDQRYDSMR